MNIWLLLKYMFSIGGNLLCISLFLASYGIFKFIASKNWKQKIFNGTFLYISLLVSMYMLIPFANLVSAPSPHDLFFDWQYHTDNIREIEMYENYNYPNLIYLFYPISRVNSYFFHVIITLPLLLFILTKNRWSIHAYFLSTVPFALILSGAFKQLTFMIFFLIFLIVWQHRKAYSIPIVVLLIYFSGLPMRFTMPTFNIEFNYLVWTPYGLFLFLLAMLMYKITSRNVFDKRFWVIFIAPIMLMVFNVQPYLRVAYLLWICLIVLAFKNGVTDYG